MHTIDVLRTDVHTITTLGFMDAVSKVCRRTCLCLCASAVADDCIARARFSRFTVHAVEEGDCVVELGEITQELLKYFFF